MKYLILLCLVGCASNPRLPSKARDRLVCVKEFVKDISTDETISICRFVTEEQK